MGHYFPQVNAMFTTASLQGLPCEMTFEVVESRVVADDAEQIAVTVQNWCDNADLAADVVFTAGGTGFGPRDGTPEAVRPLLTREAPGLVHAMLCAAEQSTAHRLGLLSRPVVGTRGRTLVATLPGSPTAATQQLAALGPFLPRIVSLIRS